MNIAIIHTATAGMAIIALLMGATSCNQSTAPTTKEVVVAIDKTPSEESPVQLTADELIDYLDLNEQDGATITITTLTSVSTTITKKTTLESGKGSLLENPRKRNRARSAFSSAVDTYLGEAYSSPPATEGSSLYIPIIRSLKTLSGSEANEKVFIVQSDLLEHSYIYSFYEDTRKKLFEKNPEALQQQFEQAMPCPDLSGIKVVFMHLAPDMERDTWWQASSKFFADYFSAKGAEVVIVSNL